MTNLTQTLFRVDPTAALVEYVKTIKPYHTKVLDVVVDYVHTEPASARVREQIAMDVEPYFSRGFGSIWDAYGTMPSGELPQASIISSNPATHTFTVSASTSSAQNFAVTRLASNQLTLVDGAGVPIPSNDVIYWPPDAAVRLSSTGQLPTPLNDTTTYYFVPSPHIGRFNLAYVRYPSQYSDYVDMTDVGSGVLSIYRTEPFVPGDVVTVSGNGANDGSPTPNQYTIQSITPNGANYDLVVLETIPAAVSGGTMAYTGSYGDPALGDVGPVPLHAETGITEHIVFVFEP